MVGCGGSGTLPKLQRPGRVIKPTLQAQTSCAASMRGDGGAANLYMTARLSEPAESSNRLPP
jgi:hypothetical protein